MIHDGLPVYKYIFKDGTLDNGADNPENKCFCRKNKCLKPGLIDVMDCYYGKTTVTLLFARVLSTGRTTSLPTETHRLRLRIALARGLRCRFVKAR